jgi:hypothetical protein
VFEAGEQVDLLFTDIQLRDNLNGGLEVAQEAVQGRSELRVSTRPALKSQTG